MLYKAPLKAVRSYNAKHKLNLEEPNHSKEQRRHREFSGLVERCMKTPRHCGERGVKKNENQPAYNARA